MDTTLIRLGSQVALVLWCMAEALVLVVSRGHWTPVAGVWPALIGLFCFGGWMFLSAMTIRDIQLFPRDQVLWLFALLEAGAAAGAWVWLIISVRHSFHFSWHKYRNRE